MSEQDFLVVNVREDKARRAWTALILIVAIGLAMVLQTQQTIAGLPGVFWSLAILAGAFVLAWRSGVLARAHAVLRIGAIRREGLAASERLHQGDIEAARLAFAALLRMAKPLGAFHAVHVLMYGVCRFLEGDTTQGLLLVSRALDSGWLDARRTRDMRDTAETWRIMMLLEAGNAIEARKRLDAMPDANLATASIMVCAWEERWGEVLDQVQAALADSRIVKVGRPTLAVMGLFAAKQLGQADAAKALEEILEAEPPGPLAQKNPALRRFLS